MDSRKPQKVLWGVLLAFIIAGISLALLRDPYPNGAKAVARVGSLRQGLTPNEFLEALHPDEMLNSRGFSYGNRTLPDGSSESIHALTRDRYLQSLWKKRGKPGLGGEPQLLSWSVESGKAPREDFTIGRVVHIGPIQIPY